MDEQGTTQRARLRLVGDIVALLAHDFGQPLNIIRLTAENGVNGDAAERRGYATIGQEAERLQAAMERLVHLTRSTQAARTIDVVAAVESAVADRRARHGADGVVLDWRPPDGCPPSRGVPERLALVLDTLLDNACDAVLNARMTRPAGTVRVTCAADAEGVAITVSDDGPGMPGCVIDAVLDPLAAPTGRRPGIGLMLSAGIVAEMGGRMRIGAGLAGTDVTIVLPVV